MWDIQCTVTFTQASTGKREGMKRPLWPPLGNSVSQHGLEIHEPRWFHSQIEGAWTSLLIWAHLYVHLCD